MTNYEWWRERTGKDWPRPRGSGRNDSNVFAGSVRLAVLGAVLAALAVLGLTGMVAGW